MVSFVNCRQLMQAFPSVLHPEGSDRERDPEEAHPEELLPDGHLMVSSFTRGIVLAMQVVIFWLLLLIRLVCLCFPGGGGLL